MQPPPNRAPRSRFNSKMSQVKVGEAGEEREREIERDSNAEGMLYALSFSEPKNELPFRGAAGEEWESETPRSRRPLAQCQTVAFLCVWAFVSLRAEQTTRCVCVS